ncbi:MAG: inorganic phosphate transporter [Telluria sp.]
MEYLLICAALLLAFANGANDNFKGFATVWGSDTLSYRQALLLATIATVAGSLLSLLLAHGLVQQFSGKGLLPAALVETPQFIFSSGTGAALTVIIATRAGLPISTTHALIGALLGAGLAVSPAEVQFARLWSTFLLPLLFSPIAAAILGLGAYRLLRLRPEQKDCVCVQVPVPGPVTTGGTSAAVPLAAPLVVLGDNAACDQLTAPTARFSLARILDRMHVLSAALICFARGVNDTPKLAALLVAAQVVKVQSSVLLIAVAMAAGGLLLARRVAETMSQRLNRMDHAQGVAANLITAALVIMASQLSLPVSTTHVSVGSIAGVGASADTLDRNTLLQVLLSWVATMPLAAMISWVALTMLR